MSNRQFVGLVVLLIIGFGAMVVVGWLSDRTAQDSNERAIGRLQDDIEELQATVSDLQEDTGELLLVLNSLENEAEQIREELTFTPSSVCATIAGRHRQTSQSVNDDVDSIWDQIFLQSQVNTYVTLAALPNCNNVFYP